MDSTTVDTKKYFSLGVSLILLIGTFLLAMYDVEAVLNITLRIMSAVGSTPQDTSALTSTLMFITSLGVLGFVIATFEYHLRHVGQAGSRRLFAISYSVLGGLAILGFLAWVL